MAQLYNGHTYREVGDQLLGTAQMRNDGSFAIAAGLFALADSIENSGDSGLAKAANQIAVELGALPEAIRDAGGAS